MKYSDRDSYPITFIISISGLSETEATTALSVLELVEPNAEILFCATSKNEPSARLVSRALANRNLTNDPNISLIFTPVRHSRNPKLDNIQAGFDAAQHDALVLLDGNIEIPGDFISQMQHIWRPDVSLVSTAPLAVDPSTFWASVEMSLITGVYARWLLAGDQLGITFASGKVLVFSRSWLNAQGGLDKLDKYVAEDMALTKLARSTGSKVKLLTRPMRQPLDHRTAKEFFSRASRWMKIRRTDIPFGYSLELIYSFWFLVLFSGLWAGSIGASLAKTLIISFIFWHALEALINKNTGAKWSPMFHVHLLVRDALTLPLWITGWFGRHYYWRGQEIRFR
ncbi:MAG: glycosyltransferase [Paracoccaceae bacterium]